MVRSFENKFLRRNEIELAHCLQIPLPAPDRGRYIPKTFWLVLVFHGVDGIGWEALPTETVRATSTTSRNTRGICGSRPSGTGRSMPGSASTACVRTNPSGDGIEVSVTRPLKPDLYDLPLTARTTIPIDWRVVRFRQGEDVRWLPVHREGGDPVVMYRIAPNGKVALLEKGLN